MTTAIEADEGRRIFGTDVSGYEHGRLDYPTEVFKLLVDRCGLEAGARVFEIGPGTGQATRTLLHHDATVTAVEPDFSLATALGKASFAHKGQLTIRNERFEGIDLPPSSYDLGVAATSFSWLDRQPALARIRSLLRPGGWWAMWWNIFADQRADPIHDELHRGLPMPPSLRRGRHEALDAPTMLGALDAVGLTNTGYYPVSRIVRMTPARLRALYATFSTLRILPPAEREARLDQAQRAAMEEASDGEIERHLITPMYIARNGT